MSNFMNKTVSAFTSQFDNLCTKVFKVNNKSCDDPSTNTITNQSSKLSSLLAPLEEYFVSIQSILIWERPYVSAVFLIAVNCLYWLIVSWTRRFFSIVSLLCLFISVYRCWSNYVWPEIRANPPEPDDGWVPVHPKVLSAPELTHYLHEIMAISGEVVEWFWQFRKNQPGLFCSLVTFLFSISAVIGSLVPGVVIVYIILMIVALGPGVVLFVVPESWYQTMRNLFENSKQSPYPSCPSSSTVLASNDDHLSVSSLEEKEQGRKLSEGYVKCDNLEESFELDKDESSLQILSDSKLDSIDFELGYRPKRESFSPSSSNNSSLQLMPSLQFGEGGETGDELEDYEIISDSDLPEDVPNFPGLSKAVLQKSKVPILSEVAQATSSTSTPIAAIPTPSIISTCTTPSKDMLESDL